MVNNSPIKEALIEMVKDVFDSAKYLKKTDFDFLLSVGYRKTHSRGAIKYIRISFKDGIKCALASLRAAKGFEKETDFVSIYVEIFWPKMKN